MDKETLDAKVTALQHSMRKSIAKVWIMLGMLLAFAVMAHFLLGGIVILGISQWFRVSVVAFSFFTVSKTIFILHDKIDSLTPPDKDDTIEK